MFKTLLPLIFSEKFFQKLIAYGLLGFIVYFLYDFLAFFFIIFICAYIFLKSGESIATRIHNWGEHGKRDTKHRIAAKYATTNIVVTALYIVFILVVILIFANIVPRIGGDLGDFVKTTPIIAGKVQEFIISIEQKTTLNFGLQETAKSIFSQSNMESAGKFALENIKNIGVIFLKFFLGLLFSYIFIIERKKIETFLKKMRDGNFAFLYDEYAVLAQKVGNGFGIIFQAQSIIALINSILTSIGLLLIGFIIGGRAFPYLITLSLIVFIFGFIPVFGTILSGIPIIIIGYSYGGLSVVFWILIMVLIIHALEAYYLNPKIVSSYMHFPVFVTFIILSVSEHFFGLIGLLVGVPTMSILISLAEDLDHHIDSIRRVYILKRKSGIQPSEAR